MMQVPKRFLASDTGDGGGGGDNAPKGLTLEIDGEQKVFTPEQVLDMHKNLAKATQNSQAAAPLLKLAEQSGLSAEELAQQAGGVFALVQDLVDQGVIDAEGNVVKKQDAQSKGDPNPSGADDQDPILQKVAQLLDAKLNEKLSPFEKAIQNLGEMNTGMQRHVISQRLKETYADAQLSDQDVTNIMAAARAGKKNIRTAAEEYIGGKKNQVDSIRQQIMDEYKKAGVDLTQFDLNNLQEQDAEGMAARIVGNNKLSFKKQKGALTPRQAAAQLLDQRLK